MRVVALVQARLGSARLRGKALRNLNGRPMLSHVLERVRATEGVDEVWLTTSLSERDRALVSVATSLGIRTFRGSEWDVLGRVTQAAQEANADVVLRATGDCPLFCPDVAAAVLRLYLETCASACERPEQANYYAWNDTAQSGWPDGTDVEVFSRHLLVTAENTMSWSRADREHVTPLIRHHAIGIITHPSPVQLSRLKLSVDKIEDFTRVELVQRRVRGYTFAALCEACVDAGIVQPEEVACLYT